MIALALAIGVPDRHPAGVDAQFTDSNFLTSDGVRLHFLQAGKGDEVRPVIVFVPGWSMPASIWKKPMELLAADFRVVALDPRGQGGSQIPGDGYTLERRAQDIAEFVARYPGAVLVSWSLGALESLEYVYVHGTGSLSGLVIVDSSVGEGATPAVPPGGSAGGFQVELRKDRVAALDGFVRAIFRTPQSEADLAALREGALRIPLEASLSLLPGNRIPREHWRAIVRAFDKPLLYLVTSQFAAQAADLKASRSSTQVEVFETAGHALFVDEPERFSRRLAAFVATLHPD
ncbi:MAG: alpha/beta hydrolase [Betaproteobacteria bacterium]